MSYFITRIYSLNIFFPYSEKITTLLVEKRGIMMLVRFINGTNDVKVALKSRYTPINHLYNDLDYFNDLDMYSSPSEDLYGRSAYIRHEI